MTTDKRHLPPPRVLTAADLALMLAISVPHARRLLRTRQIPGVKLGGRWRVSREAVVDRIERMSGLESDGQVRR